MINKIDKMNPKEKAKDLISKFYLQTAQQCALIAVELLIDCTHSEDIVIEQIGANGRDRNAKYTYEYWEQVKIEITNL